MAHEAGALEGDFCGFARHARIHEGTNLVGASKPLARDEMDID